MNQENNSASKPSLITVKQLAERLGMDRSTLHRNLKSRGFVLIDVRGPDTRFQKCKALTLEEAERYSVERTSSGADLGQKMPQKITGGVGMIYALQPDPSQRPDYIKVGWTTDPAQRFREFRTLCPHLKLLRLWKAPQQAFEVVALEIAKHQANQVGAELFEGDAEVIVAALDTFFGLLGTSSILSETSSAIAA